MFEQKDAKMSGEIISFHWDSLPAELQDRMKSKKIKFQGTQVLLRDIIGESFDRNVPSIELLSKLMEERTIGDDGYSKKQYFDDENIFIERHLIRNRVYDFMGQLKKFKDRVFLTGITEHELIEKGFQKSCIKKVSKENCMMWGYKAFFLADKMEDAGVIFQIISNKLKTVVKIHWIHYMENEFYYVSSVGIGKQQFKFVEEKIHEDELVNLTLENKRRVILIIDEPGSGKSTILLKLCQLVKEKTPSTWVIMRSFKELFSGYENLKNAFIGNDAETFIDSFINGICKGDQVDKELLKLLIQKHLRVSIFLDGFDELASKHKSKAIHLVKQLRKFTGAQIWITSQTSDTKKLFVSLETLPYSLKLWNVNEQRRYLCKLWCKLLSDCDLSKAKHKVSQTIEATKQSQTASIYNLNLQLKNLLESDEMGNSSSFRKELKEDTFCNLAAYLLEKGIFKIDFKYLGIPLYVYVIGNVLYHNNFVFEVSSNPFSLFSEFVKQKIEIFLREKCELNYENDYCKKIARREEKIIEAIHKKIAKQTLVSGNNNNLSLQQVSDYEYLNDIGLVKVKGNEFVFFHKSIEEYFLSASILEDMENGSPDAKLLSRIIVEREWNDVAIFLNGALEVKMPETCVKPNFFDDFNLRKTFEDFFSFSFKNKLSQCIRIWNYVILQLESQENESLTEECVSFLKNSMKPTFDYDRNGFHLFMLFRKEKWIIKIFDFRDNLLENTILSSFSHCSAYDFELILKNIEYCISIKSNCSYCKDFMKIQDEGGECSERHSVKCSKERLMNELFEKKDHFGCNLIRIASNNEDASVFEMSIVNAKRLIGGNYIKFLKTKDSFRQGILHCSSVRKAKNMKKILELLDFHLAQDEVQEILTSKNIYGTPDLWSVIQFWESDGLNEFLDYVRKVLKDEDLYKNVLLTQNKRKETILHSVLCKPNYNSVGFLIQEACKLLDVNSFNGKEEFINWIKAKNNYKGYNIATWAAKHLDKYKLKEFFEDLRTFINDDKILCIIIFEGIFLCLKFACDYRYQYNDRVLMVFDYVLSLIPDDHSSMNKLFKTRSSISTRNFIDISTASMDSGNLKILMETLVKTQVLDLHELRELLFEVDEEGNTILHGACENRDERVIRSLVFDEILKLCDGEELRNLIMKMNNYGHNFITHAFRFWNLEEIANLIKELKNSHILDLYYMRKLFSENDKSGFTILHCACKSWDRKAFHLIFNEVIKLFNEDKQELKRLLMKVDIFGHTIITLPVLLWEKENISKLIEELKKTEALDLNDMRELFLTIDEEGNTILHRSRMNVNRGVFGLLLVELVKLLDGDKHKLKSLIMRANHCGYNIITNTVTRHDSEELENVIEGLKETEVVDSDAMRKLFFGIDKSGNTILHLAGNRHNDIVFSLVCDEIMKLFNRHEEQLMSLIMKSNGHGMTFLHSGGLSKISIDVLEQLRDFIGNKGMTELLLRVDKEGNMCLHYYSRHDVFTDEFKEKLLFISKWMHKSDMEKLILAKDRNGKSFYERFYGLTHVRGFLNDFLWKETLLKLREIEPEEPCTRCSEADVSSDDWPTDSESEASVDDS